MRRARRGSSLAGGFGLTVAMGSAFAFAAAPAPSGAATSLDVGSSPASAGRDTTLRSLAWLAGCWGTTHDGVEMEEHWTAPKGGVMLALHRDLFASGRVFFEFLRIEQRPDGVFYVAQPRGRPPTDFRLVESGERRAVFANPAHDFPKRILYWLDETGVLHARTEGEEEGVTRIEEWAWPRVVCAGP